MRTEKEEKYEGVNAPFSREERAIEPQIRRGFDNTDIGRDTITL